MAALHDIIESTVVGLGYELVEIEFAAGGLLRVFIDAPAVPTGISMDDCERVSHQLSHVLMVEDVDYSRLEVSSPGLDRPLNKAADYERFVGQEISLRLRVAFEGRRNFVGLVTLEPQGRFGLELIDEAARAAAAAQRGPRRRGAGPVSRRSVSPPSAGADTVVLTGKKLVFALDEVDRARLVPKVNFREKVR